MYIGTSVWEGRGMDEIDPVVIRVLLLCSVIRVVTYPLSRSILKTTAN